MSLRSTLAISFVFARPILAAGGQIDVLPNPATATLLSAATLLTSPAGAEVAGAGRLVSPAATAGMARSLAPVAAVGNATGGAGASTAVPGQEKATMALAPGEWTWMSGSSVVDQYGIYGTLGTPAATNTPGARQYPVSWTDGSGNLWLFGGSGNSADGGGIQNDLWKYSTAIGEWTWMSGSSTSLSYNYGKYGTLGTPAGTNVPGGRYQSVSWTDGSGNLWLFGGTGFTESAYGNLNDLWKYSTTTGEWTWMGGSNIPNQAGSYGTIGTPAASNMPRARNFSTSWTDGNGNLWLFGGYFTSSPGNYLQLNDLWKYSITSEEWTWVSGSNAPAQFGSYGALGTPAASNVPGARQGSISWTDGSGNLWLFGGWGNAASTSGFLNDLWQYNVTSGSWTVNVLPPPGAGLLKEVA